ncbi:Ig-like domain-containing protein [Colwellia sp. TT2012]|uniref:Ig-like domain-containing protein n=1 Tax=Colwellia sp. TT2012 TaxID=1720342 RepID=UPI00070CB340|nr:Ig-like domain-containing protein [Colwellia sp. TT2012]
MNLIKNLSKITLVALAITTTLLTGCESDNNSAELAKAVELEKQRTLGTIIESVTITNAQTRLKAGETHQLSATGIDSKDAVRDVTNELTWTSSDTTIATVNSKGLVTAVANSEVNQGTVIITGSTINDITGEGEISVSDVAVSNISLKQTSPESGHINTCFDASIKGDVGYEDGYISLNTVKDMTFSLDSATSAVINKEGTLYTSAAGIENITITAKVNNISAQLIVTADAKDLDTIDILQDDKTTTFITLNIGERIQVNAQAKLIATVSTDTFIIDSTITWSQADAGYIGITATGDNKGTLFALKPGVTQLIGSCGGKKSIATIQVKGAAALDGIQINAGEDILIIAPLQSIELTLTANYTSTPTSLNVSEFAQWSINGSNLLEAELSNLGTDIASYTLTSTKNSVGFAFVSVIYQGITRSVRIEIER